MGRVVRDGYRNIASLAGALQETMTNAQQSTGDEAVDASTIDQRDAADAEDTDAHREHLDDVEDGCGCTEIWEHLSENREAEAEADD